MDVHLEITSGEPRNFRSALLPCAANGRQRGGHDFYQDLLCYELRPLYNGLQRRVLAMTPLRHARAEGRYRCILLAAQIGLACVGPFQPPST